MSGKMRGNNSKGDHVRNLCIMAHVDHGKTTLADVLIASNGIISEEQAGSIKYMDSRRDEMERGITMKSSCITLAHSYQDKSYLVNLIDSPGHVDFTSEVSTAVRLCDGCILVVDVVEGVCAQTKAVMRQAWVTGVKPVLVLNKLDRLVLEKALTPLDAYYHIAHVLQQVNAYMAELYNTDVFGRTNLIPRRTSSSSSGGPPSSPSKTKLTGRNVADWVIEDVDDSDLYFNPVAGNVVFCSAIDGWGFGIAQFAEQFSSKLGMSYKALMQTLWGDYYISSKNGEKRILKGARDKRKNPLFVTLVLDNLYELYRKVRPTTSNLDDVRKIAQSLAIDVPSRLYATSSESKSRFLFICSSWLPLAKALLKMIVEQLPPPTELSEERAKKLLTTATLDYNSLPQESRDLLPHMQRCSNDDTAPLVVYVSKMFGVPKKKLEEAEAKLAKAQAIARGDILPPVQQYRLRAPARGVVPAGGGVAEGGGGGGGDGVNGDTGGDGGGGDGGDTLQGEQVVVERKDGIAGEPEGGAAADPESGGGGEPAPEDCDDGHPRPVNSETKTDVLDVEDSEPEEEVEELLAFARVFSGSLKPGQEVYVLGPKHSPTAVVPLMSQDGQLSEADLQRCPYVTRCKVGSVFLLLGREVKCLASAGAGLMVGIAGLTDYVIKSASLSSTPACPPFTHVIDSSSTLGMAGAAMAGDPCGPILRVHVLPSNPRCLGKLREGLRLLNQADPCVQVWLESTGEYMVGAAGEVHLQRCLTDLEERYARTPVTASDPIVPFRETVVPLPSVDNANEAIEGTVETKQEEGDAPGAKHQDTCLGRLALRAAPLPPAVTALLYSHTALLRVLAAHSGHLEAGGGGGGFGGDGGLLLEAKGATRGGVGDKHQDKTEKSGTQDKLDDNKHQDRTENHRHQDNIENSNINNSKDSVHIDNNTSLNDTLILDTKTVSQNVHKDDTENSINENSICTEDVRNLATNNDLSLPNSLLSTTAVNSININGDVPSNISSSKSLTVDTSEVDELPSDLPASTESLSRETKAALVILQKQLSEAFDAAGPEWCGAADQMWSVGPHYCGPNVLINRTAQYVRPSMWEMRAAQSDSHFAAMDHGLVTGFQLCSAAGTLCEEPLMGVCFLLEDWQAPVEEVELPPGKVIAVSKDIFLTALEEQPRRMMAATYSCVINVTTDVVGRVYSVLGKRHGRILHGDITEGSTAWNVTALLPIVESIDFANELRKATSGEAQPQLVFSHWETLDIDPYWDPHTAEELKHFGQKSDTDNLARHYMNTIRRRKGIKEYGKKLVEFGEKQRTLTKNK